MVKLEPVVKAPAPVVAKIIEEIPQPREKPKAAKPKAAAKVIEKEPKVEPVQKPESGFGAAPQKQLVHRGRRGVKREPEPVNAASSVISDADITKKSRKRKRWTSGTKDVVEFLFAKKHTGTYSANYVFSTKIVSDTR
jgi:hypothetical protein